MKTVRKTRSGRPKMVVAAGPTRERIDPVRFLSNYSTGRFGYEIARAASQKGFDVILVSGPTALKKPAGVKIVNIESAAEMKKELTKAMLGAGYLIMASAVSDYRPARVSNRKIKRGGGMTLRLVQNPDILAGIAGKTDAVICGFALETEALLKNAFRKLKKKKLDIIVANITALGREAFGDALTDVVILDRLGGKSAYKDKSKKTLAGVIVNKVANFKDDK